MGRVLMSTQDEIAGLEITHMLGLLAGIGVTIHSEYRANEPFLEKKLEGARDVAIERMRENAEARDADAVVGMPVETAGIYNGSAGTQAFTVQAYGTAVITELRTSPGAKQPLGFVIDFRVNAGWQPLPAKSRDDVIHRHLGHFRPCCHAGAGDMRHDQAVIQAKQRVIQRYRLRVSDVKPSREDCAVSQGSIKRFRVKHATASGIDQDRCRFHQPKLAVADQMMRLVGEGNMQANEVALGQSRNRDPLFPHRVGESPPRFPGCLPAGACQNPGRGAQPPLRYARSR